MKFKSIINKCIYIKPLLVMPLAILIEKTTSNFQNLQEYVIDLIFRMKDTKSLKWLKNRFFRFLQLMEISN